MVQKALLLTAFVTTLVSSGLNAAEWRITGEVEIDRDEYSGKIIVSDGAKLYLNEATIYGELHIESGGSTFVWGDGNSKIKALGAQSGYLQNSGFLRIVPLTELDVDGQVDNGGLIQLIGGGLSAIDTFDNNNTGVIRGHGLIYGGQQFRNGGRVSAFGGSLLIAADGPLIAVGTLENTPSASLHIRTNLRVASPAVEPAIDVNNLGIVRVRAGGGITLDCALINEAGGTIELLGGTLGAKSITQKQGATLRGFGNITADLLIEPNGLAELTGSTDIVGNIEIRENASIEVRDGTILTTGQTTCNGTIHMKGGRVIPQGGLSGNCNIIWEPGTYNNIADFNLDGEVNFKDFVDFADTWLWQTSW